MSGPPIAAVAAGDYPGAPSVAALRIWARRNGISAESEGGRWVARLRDCGGMDSTPDGALYLLYYSLTRTG